MKKLSVMVAVMLAANLLQAEVRYVQATQGIAPTGNSIDIDGDGFTNYIFQCDLNCNVHGSFGESFFAAEGLSDTLPKAYNLGDSMGVFHWVSTMGVLSSIYNTGNFRDGTYKYLMVKFIVSSNTYYGWFRISGTTVFNLTLWDYAYEDVPGQMISPGQVTTGINEIDNAANFKLYPNPSANKLNITTTVNKNQSIHYQIINTLGEAVMTGSSNENEFSADVSTLPSGVYFIGLQSESGSVVKRFVRE